VTGAAGNDLLRLNDGGNDSAFGGGGNDVLYFGGAFTGADVADGGEGRDALVLQGNYALTLSATNLVGIESISLQSGSRTTWGDVSNHFYDYALTTSDSNVAAGQQLIVNGQTLRAGEDFSFDGSAETDGTFLVYGGHGVDTLKGGAGNDAFFFEGDRWGPGDTVDGGAGRDALIISSGSGINHFDFGATALTGIESISLNNRYTTDPSQKPSYELVLSNGNVAPGATLIVNGSSLADRAQTVSVDGSAVHDGNLILFGGFGNDTLTGGDGADLFQGGEGIDVLTGGGGADVFRYAGPYDATSQLPDRILDFASGVDKIDLTRIDADLFTAGDQAFHWIGSAAFGGDGAASAGELRAYDFNGSWFVEGDMDGNGSADLVIQLTTPPAPVVQADFLL
jgi:Ca2+-binding RTX toxin-like protein